MNAVAQGYGAVPDYDAAWTESIVAAAEATSQLALHATRDQAVFDPGAFANTLSNLVPRLRQMFDIGMRAFNIMLDLREAHFRGILIFALASALAGLGLGLALHALGVTRHSRPRLRRGAGVEAPAGGDLARDVPRDLARFRDELGTRARTVDRPRGQLQDQVASIALVVDRLSGMRSTLASNAEQVRFGHRADVGGVGPRRQVRGGAEGADRRGRGRDEVDDLAHLAVQPDDVGGCCAPGVLPKIHADQPSSVSARRPARPNVEALWPRASAGRARTGNAHG